MMEESGLNRLQRPRRLSKRNKPWRQKPYTQNKVQQEEEKTAATLSVFRGATSCHTGGFYTSELQDIKQRLSVLETRRDDLRPPQTGCRDCAFLRSVLGAVIHKLSDIEARLDRRPRSPPAEPAEPQEPLSDSPVARRQLFKGGPGEDAQPVLPASATPACSSITTPAPGPSPDVSVRDLSSERDEELYRDSFVRGEHRPEVYAAHVFMALTPFELYQSWGKKVNWSGSNGKMELPVNLKEKIHSHVVQRFPDVSGEQWQGIRNRINERLRSPRKVDPEMSHPGFCSY